MSRNLNPWSNFPTFMDGYRSVSSDRETAETRRDCRDFYRENIDDLRTCVANGLTWARLGEDFYWTRNRHGAGYWDEKHRGAAADAALDRLTMAAHVYGSTE